MRREIFEEVGLTIQDYSNWGRVRFLFSKKPICNSDVQIFIVEKWQGEPIETEAIKPMWFPQNALPLKQMWQDNSFWVPDLLNGKQIDSIFLLNPDGSIVEYRG